VLTSDIEKAVVNFFKPASQKEPEKVTWRVVDETLLIGKYRPSEETPKNLEGKRRIAAFDFVGHFFLYSTNFQQLSLTSQPAHAFCFSFRVFPVSNLY
jgi:hypothetical protein